MKLLLNSNDRLKEAENIEKYQLDLIANWQADALWPALHLSTKFLWWQDGLSKSLLMLLISTG